MVMEGLGEDTTEVTPVRVGFESWYRLARPRVATSLAIALGDRELASDVTDEAFVRVLQRWQRLSQFEHLTPYVYKVAFNLARRQLRRRAIAARLLPLVARAEQDPPTDELWMAISELSDRRREAVVLRHVGQLTEPEIAEAMGITRGTVSRTLRAAYDQLRTDLNEKPFNTETTPEKEDRDANA